MATIVKHKKSDRNFIFLSAGFGAYKATRPSFIGGNLFPTEDEGTIRMAVVTDEHGILHWVPSNELQVIEIDGVKIGNLLTKI